MLGFVRRDSDRDTPWFSVVVFAGQTRRRLSTPGGFLERDISLADGDISLDRDAIVVTPDVSDDLSRRYRWDPAKQRHVFVRDDASEEPDVAAALADLSAAPRAVAVALPLPLRRSFTYGVPDGRAAFRRRGAGCGCPSASGC